MPNLKYLRPVDFRWTVLAYGPPASGKTSALATWPKLYVYLADPNGLVPCAGMDIEYDEYFDPDPYSPTAMRRALEFAERQRVNPEFDSYLIDVLGWWGTVALNEAKRREGATRGKTQVQHYGVMNDILREFLTMVLGTGKNVLMTAHNDYEKDELTGQLWHHLYIYGGRSMRGYLPSWFDEVWFFEVKRGEKREPVYTVHTVAPGERMWAKTRRRGIPSEFTWDRFKENFYLKVSGFVKDALVAAEGGDAVTARVVNGGDAKRKVVTAVSSGSRRSS